MRLLCFTNTLRVLKWPLVVQNLRINLKKYSFRNDGQVQVFADRLSKNMQVRGSFCLSGTDVHLERQVRKLPLALKMDMQPSKMNVRFRGRAWHDLGTFESHYVPQKTSQTYEEGLCKYDCTQTLDDPTSRYAAWLETAPREEIVNGLDYATETGYGDFYF